MDKDGRGADADPELGASSDSADSLVSCRVAWCICPAALSFAFRVPERVPVGLPAFRWDRNEPLLDEVGRGLPMVSWVVSAT